MTGRTTRASLRITKAVLAESAKATALRPASGRWLWLQVGTIGALARAVARYRKVKSK